ncbi:MAG: MBL fold metallo-hydrolase [Bacilli bacterium]|nr:MBL fold metallo-hydrolase [Bacilli bacterium]
MNYKIINSGSDGNCLIIENKIAIDVGVSYKKLSPYVKNLKIIFLTHRHGDHFNKATIKKLANDRPTLRFACCEWLVKDLIDCGVEKKNIDLLKTGKIYNYNTFKVIPIKLYHDVPQCGYKLLINGYKLIYATDTNRIDHIDAKNYDYYFIEGNYENDEELHNRSVDEFYENRVKNTHLSKVKASEWLMENMGNSSKYIFMHEHKEKGKSND